MQVPIRLVLLLRPSVSAGIVLAVAFSTFVLGSTPFLYGLVVDEYGIGLTEASLIGVFQLGGFVVGSWAAGRRLRPRRRVFVAALALALLANLASVWLPPFPLLIGLRLASGLALGITSWFAWVQVFGDDDAMGDIAASGPLAGVLTGPVIAVTAQGGAAAIFALLSALAVVPLLFNRGAGASHRLPARSGRSKPVPAAVGLLAGLGLFTLGGSTVFQFAVVLGTERLGLSAGTLALLFSFNAAASVPAAKWPWRRGLPGPWMAATAVCAVTLATTTSTPVFVCALTLWGFAFWMGIPGVFSVLAERSAHPADRAGDAQAMMAAGRVGGPFIGGALLDNTSVLVLGLVGGGLMLGAAVLVLVLRSVVPPRLAVAPVQSAGSATTMRSGRSARCR
jgi:DHA1 family inner membrane transport protein